MAKNDDRLTGVHGAPSSTYTGDTGINGYYVGLGLLAIADSIKVLADSIKGFAEVYEDANAPVYTVEESTPEGWLQRAARAVEISENKEDLR
jgi:hypothetical protein